MSFKVMVFFQSKISKNQSSGIPLHPVLGRVPWAKLEVT